VYFGFGKPDADESLRMGPNIAPWPAIPPLSENLLLKLASVLKDPVTTTDELIPSGETSSYRSNPLRLAEFTLSRRDPGYVARAKQAAETDRRRAKGEYTGELGGVMEKLGLPAATLGNTSFNSVIFANKPGDGSAREQAASCQRVLGGGANICYEYATKRYRSNCINWGMLPFTLDAEERADFELGDYVFVPGIKQALERGDEAISATLLTKKEARAIKLNFSGLTGEEREIILSGCLMNYYAGKKNKLEA
jgi:aconitate hydratase